MGVILSNIHFALGHCFGSSRKVQSKLNEISMHNRILAQPRGCTKIKKNVSQLR